MLLLPLDLERFNPSVGILWGGTCIALGVEYRQLVGFNPSVGILWGGTGSAFSCAPPFPWFQSLGRDSVGWDFPSHVRGRGGVSVSIPRSGFCGVGLIEFPGGPPPAEEFQSLGRDSVGWDLSNRFAHVKWEVVSIPRSGFCGVGPGKERVLTT